MAGLGSLALGLVNLNRSRTRAVVEHVRRTGSSSWETRRPRRAKYEVMDIHEVPITGPRYNIGADGRCGVSRVQIARTIAQYYGWVERDGQVCRRSELGGDVIAESDTELGDAMRALGWISDPGYPVWSDLPGLETRAADQVSRNLTGVGAGSSTGVRHDQGPWPAP